MDYNQNDFDNNQMNNENTYVYDNNYTETYNDPYDYNPQMQKQSGMGIASLVLGICGFFILLNPFSVCSILAIVFGIIGVCKSDCKKGCAIAGIILGGVSLIWDWFLTIITGGTMFFC